MRERAVAKLRNLIGQVLGAEARNNRVVILFYRWFLAKKRFCQKMEFSLVFLDFNKSYLGQEVKCEN